MAATTATATGDYSDTTSVNSTVSSATTLSTNSSSDNHKKDKNNKKLNHKTKPTTSHIETFHFKGTGRIDK